MFMVLSSWQSHCESSPSLFDECRMAPGSRRPKTKPDNLGCESACTGCQKLHPPSPFIIITQPESWYSFYRPTEGRRLSRPSWLVIYRDGLPVHRRSPILELTGSVDYVDRGQRVNSKPNRQTMSAPSEPTHVACLFIYLLLCFRCITFLQTVYTTCWVSGSEWLHPSHTSKHLNHIC